MAELPNIIEAWRRSFIERKAAAWIARLKSDRCTATDRHRFSAWYGRSPLHAEIFAEATTAWGELQLVERLNLTQARSATEPSATWLSRRRVLAAFGGTAVAGGGFLALNAAAATTYRTQLGEQRHVNVVDGLQLDLDALSRVGVNRAGTSLDVEEGRVRITVAHHETIIRFGTGRLVAQSALFDMECREGTLVNLLLIEGTCRLQMDGNEDLQLAAPSLLDGKGMMLSRPDGITLDRMTAWREGRAIFDNERLADAIALMNRYDRRQLRLLDSNAANQQISGTFRLGDNHKFAEALEVLLPVSMRPVGSALLLSSSLQP